MTAQTILAYMTAAAIALGLPSTGTDIWNQPAPPPPAQTIITPEPAPEPAPDTCVTITITDGRITDRQWNTPRPASYTTPTNHFPTSIVGHYLWIGYEPDTRSIDITGLTTIEVCNG